jgi:FSR family fosmidomycin resistance protein-like MFS transporter
MQVGCGHVAGLCPSRYYPHIRKSKETFVAISPLRNSKLWMLSLAHFFTDFFSGAIATIVLAAQTEPLGLTQSQVGLLAFLYAMATSVTQPLFGWLSDRVRGPLLALAGFLWMLGFFALSGLAGSFLVFMGLLIAAGLGVSAFHPPGAAGARVLSQADSRGRAMSIFLTGGAFGHAFGPFAAGMILEPLGPRGTLVMAAFGLLVAPALVWGLSRLRYDAPMQEEPDRPRSKLDLRAASILGIVILMLVIFARTWALRSLRTFLPQYYTTVQGLPLDFSGNVLFIWGLPAAFGSLVSGFVADRVGRRVVIVATLLLSAPLIFFQLQATGLALVIITALVGFCITASNPLTVSLGQELIPDRPGMMSGLAMGFTFVMGGIGTYLTGILADSVGLETALGWLTLPVLIGAVLAMFLPRAERRAQQPVSQPVETTGDR